VVAIVSLSRILGLSFVSGINLYATILAVGLAIRYNWVADLPPELQILAHPAVLVVAGAMYVIEFLADKVPIVSTLWDALHTFIRPVGGALLALAGASNLDPALQIVAFMVGGSVALGTHSTKMGARLLAHKYPEPIAHSTVSVMEDIGVVGLLTLIYTHPLSALVLILCLIACMIWLSPLLFRTIACLLNGVIGRLLFWRSTPTRPPIWLTARLSPMVGPDDRHFYPCFARSIKGAPRLKRGYYCVDRDQAFFACHGLFKPKVIPLGSSTPEEVHLRRGLILDLLLLGNPAGSHHSLYFSRPHSRTWCLNNLRSDRGVAEAPRSAGQEG